MALSEPVILSCLMVLRSAVPGVTKSIFVWMGAGIWGSVVDHRSDPHNGPGIRDLLAMFSTHRILCKGPI